MSPDELFVRSLADLETRMRKDSSEYELLGAAALLRKLVIDGDRLVDVVNRRRRLRIRFEICHREVPRNPEALFYVTGEGFDPKSATSECDARSLSAAKFQAEPIGLAGGQVFTVRDLIVFMANVLGGVHVRNVKSPREVAVAMLHGGLRQEMRDGTLRHGAYVQLLPIARVAVRGLEPMRQAILTGH